MLATIKVDLSAKISLSLLLMKNEFEIYEDLDIARLTVLPRFYVIQFDILVPPSMMTLLDPYARMTEAVAPLQFWI